MQQDTDGVGHWKESHAVTNMSKPGLFEGWFTVLQKPKKRSNVLLSCGSDEIKMSGPPSLSVPPVTCMKIEGILRYVRGRHACGPDVGYLALHLSWKNAQCHWPYGGRPTSRPHAALTRECCMVDGRSPTLRLRVFVGGTTPLKC